MYIRTQRALAVGVSDKLFLYIHKKRGIIKNIQYIGGIKKLEELDELKKKINHLEYDEIKTLKDDITQIKIDLNTNNLLTQQSIKSNEKLSTTLESVQTAMFEITESLKDSNKISTELTQTVSNLNNKVDVLSDNTNERLQEFNNKIIAIDNKSKIDITELEKDKFSDNAKKYLVGGGSVGFIILLFELLTKVL